MNHEIEIKRIGARRAVVLRNVTLFGVDIPEGFETDGATVPRLFWWILSPFTLGLYASVTHDFQLSDGDKYKPKRRKQIDKQFYYNLRESGINIIRASAVWLGVRIWSHVFILKHKVFG
jgi:hypothetical protein